MTLVDPIISSILGGGSVVAFLWFIARWAWLATHKRIDEAYRSCENIADRLREHDREDRERHDVVIKATTRLETQMERFVSDMTSEKRTRAEVNRELFIKLDQLRERLPERRDEKR